MHNYYRCVRFFSNVIIIIIIIIIIINIFHGQNNITCSTNCKYRTAATLYTLETWFVSGI
jgi:hypothetical protein